MKQHYIKINHELIPVSEEAYQTASRWKERARHPDDALRIKAIAPENVLGSLQAGDTVSVRWQYIENMSEPVKGTVEKISRIPQTESTGVEEEYAVYITVEDASCFYYGMNVTVTGGV